MPGRFGICDGAERTRHGPQRIQFGVESSRLVEAIRRRAHYTFPPASTALLKERSNASLTTKRLLTTPALANRSMIDCSSATNASSIGTPWVCARVIQRLATEMELPVIFAHASAYW